MSIIEFPIQTASKSEELREFLLEDIIPKIMNVPVVQGIQNQEKDDLLKNHEAYKSDFWFELYDSLKKVQAIPTTSLNETDLQLAKRMIGHDLYNIIQRIPSNLGLAKELQDEDEEEMHEAMDMAITNISKIKHFVNVQHYLTTGVVHDDIKITSKELPSFFPRAKVDVTIPTDSKRLVTLIQMYNNNNKYNLQTTINGAYDANGYGYFRVEDNGKGFLDRNGTPLYSDRIENVFGDTYTTDSKGTGYGLTLAKRLNSDIDLVTTIQDEEGKFKTTTIFSGEKPKTATGILNKTGSIFSFYSEELNSGTVQQRVA